MEFNPSYDSIPVIHSPRLSIGLELDRCAGKLSKPTHYSPFFILINYKEKSVICRILSIYYMNLGAYLFHNLFFSMAWAFYDFPELNEFVEFNLTISIKVDCIEKFVRWEFSEIYFFPVFLCLCSVNRLIAIFIKDLKNILHYLFKLLWKFLLLCAYKKRFSF